MLMSTQTLYQGHIVQLDIQDQRWEIVRHASAVAILAQREDGKMLCVRQYRVAIDRHTIEAPAGLIDTGETPLEAAQRELSEECNLGGSLTLLNRSYSSPGFCDEEVFIFRATDLFHNPGTPDADENIEVLWLDPKELLVQLRSGEVSSSTTTLAACLYAL